MTSNSGQVRAGVPEKAGPGPHYKWIALSNTTLGVLMATVNQSIVLIALPDIFRGIGLNPLSSANTSYLLWMFMGFLVVSAVLVVSFGRLGDMFGRVRMYNMGFAIFSVASIFLTVTWMHGSAGALWLIIWRIVQGIGGAFLFVFFFNDPATTVIYTLSLHDALPISSAMRRTISPGCSTETTSRTETESSIS